MASSGTKKTGFAIADLGPFRCDNCHKWSDGVCFDSEVAEDKGIVDRKNRLMQNGHIKTDRDDCCNEFLSMSDEQKSDSKVPSRKEKGEGGLGMRLIGIGRSS